jgi:hypothetical protein
MTITVDWDNSDHSIIRYIYNDKLVWDELYAAIRAGHRLMDMANGTVDIIVDVRNSKLISTSALPRSRQAMQMVHPRQGIVMVVGASTWLRGLVDLYSRVYGRDRQKFWMVDSVEEAHQLIRQIRASGVTTR